MTRMLNLGKMADVFNESNLPPQSETTGGSPSYRSLTLRGLFNSSAENSDHFTPRGTLAFVTTKEGKLPGVNEVSVTRRFFDEMSERAFLSFCSHGNENLPEQVPTPSTEDDWKSVKYMSKVKHTWYFYKTCDVCGKDEIQISGEAVESLQTISKNLKSQQPNSEDSVVTFFKEFGSHLSMGPFIIGGRCIQRVVSSGEFSGADCAVVLNELEKVFSNMTPEEVDLSSAGGDSHILTIGDNQTLVEVSRQVELFGGNSKKGDFKNWLQSLPNSDLVVSGAVSKQNIAPVWEILSYQECIADDVRVTLGKLLETTWQQLSGANNLGRTETVSHTNRESDEGSDYETASDNDDTEMATHPRSSTKLVNKGTGKQARLVDKGNGNQRKDSELFLKLNLDGKIHSLGDATVLRKNTLEGTGADIMWDFLTSISSLDYRGRHCIKLQTQSQNGDNSADGTAEEDIFAEDDVSDSDPNQAMNTISSMDVTMAVLHSCDPFLRQELMWKMAECRLAVPVLLAALTEDEPIEFQLWGLRKIFKSWIPRNMDTPIEKSVVAHPIPIVTFLRFGTIPISKSKLLNKILGKLQGNNDHSFFVDSEDEPPCAKWSKGNVEAAWFLPDSVRSGKNESTLEDAVTFLNLRGDALKYPVQMQFVCRAADVVVLLMKGDQYKENLSKIKELSESLKRLKRNLMCMICTNDATKGSTVKRQEYVTKMFTKPFLSDVGADICIELKRILWASDPQISAESNSFRSIESLVDLHKDLNFEIDENREDCLAAKKLAQDIVKNVRDSPETYKENRLPLQGDLWRKWADLDKNWNKGYRPSAEFRTIEHYHDDLKERMLQVREEQIKTRPGNDVVKFTEALKWTDASKPFFIEWFNFYINDLSQDKLGPLRKQLLSIQIEAREINSEKSRLNDQPEKNDEDNTKLQKLVEKDLKLLRQAQEITKKIDSGSVGMEHFIREIGQRFEAYDDTKGRQGTDVDHMINPEILPDIAADLLINGYPLEILDGDVGRVPIKWVQAVLASVIQKIGNATVCAISVLGIQSSGKSTLLNSMFGVRFAVSAGRCTRGVFIQLLKVHEDLRKEAGCEYVMVIDTEGLKAPERSLRDDFRHDNELATFALCLADLTIVNIAGQTVGKDMTDVLQIAAHAFIRMKEVHIKSSCRIIQQFVADLAAADKNEACTQAILNSLDESIAAAGKDEGYGEIYTRFSDVFNLKRNKDVQYIPSLWQGSMAPPNHRYSEKILKLKNIIVRDLKMSSRTMDQFVERTTTVWNAVKEENFIFSFQNCVIALRYKTFQHAYGKWVGEMRQAIMEWESNAKQTLKTAQKDEVYEMKQQLKIEIGAVVEKEADAVEKHVLEYLKENMEDDDDQLHKFEEEFLQDLDLTKRSFQQDARESLDRMADSIAQLNHMDVLLPNCKNQLREKARKQAIELRKEHAEALSLDKVISDDEIKAKFDELWECWIKEICGMYPPKKVTQEDVESEFGFYACHQGEKKDISKGLKRRLGITRGKAFRIVANIASTTFHGNQKEVVDQIIENSLASLQIDLFNELAFDPAIIQKLIDSTIDALNGKYKGTTLTQEIKVNTIAEVCERAIPMVLRGRREYNNKYSLRQLLTREKENLREDFKALCSDAFQDRRAAENVNALLVEKVVEVVRNFLGPAIYKASRERCPYFASKFALFGHVLEDIAVKEDFTAYYKFVFELEEFVETWSLKQIAKICTKTTESGKSFVQYIANDKIEEITKRLLKSVQLTIAANLEKNSVDSRERFTEWITLLRTKVLIPGLRLSDDDVRNLLMFNVEDIKFFGDQVAEYIKHSLSGKVLQVLNLPSVGCRNEAEIMLRSLPTKPHKEIKRHVSGCMEQCPICHVPCDNMTKKHEKHRAELHYPEGVVGCAAARDDRLTCNICTSSVTTADSYWDGQQKRKYCDYQKDFPSWVIQPIQNDTPLNYWKWVLNRFNEDFARLYGREEADLPRGWIEITKKQALDDLREAYVTKKTSNGTASK